MSKPKHSDPEKQSKKRYPAARQQKLPPDRRRDTPPRPVAEEVRRDERQLLLDLDGADEHL